MVDLIDKAIRRNSLISASLSNSLGRLTSLNQSVLAKAFRGELVPQDPTDEPASTLLARIQSERAEVEATKKRRPKKKKGQKNDRSHPVV